MIVQAKLISNELNGQRITERQVGSILLVELDSRMASHWVDPKDKQTKVIEVVYSAEDNDEIFPLNCIEMFV